MKRSTITLFTQYMNEKMTLYVSNDNKESFAKEYASVFGRNTEIKESLLVLGKDGSISYYGYLGHMQYGSTIHDELFFRSIARVDDVVILNYETCRKYDAPKEYAYGLVMEKGKKRYLVDLMDADDLDAFEKEKQNNTYLMFAGASVVMLKDLFEYRDNSMTNCKIC